MKSSFSDQIFESLLEEAVGGKSPPNLKAKILDAWEAEQANIPSEESVASQGASRPLIVAELVKPSPKSDVDEFEARPIRSSESTQRAIQTTATGEAVAADERNKTRPAAGPRTVSSPAWRSLLSLSAVGLLAIAGWSIATNFSGSDGDAITASTPTSSKSRDGDDAAGSFPIGPSLATDATGNPLSETDNDTIEPETLDLGNLPFPASDVSTNALASTAPGSASLDTRPDAMVVQSLNAKLASLWSSLGVEPTPAEEDQVLVRKLSKRFSAKPTRSDGKLAAIRSLVQSPGFAKDVSDYFSRTWLGNRISDEREGRELRGFLQASIFRGHSLSNVAAELLGGEIKEGSPASVLVGRLAGNGNHSLAQRLGSNFLDARLACARCHDSNSAATLTSDLATQENYWSLIALLKGIEVSKEGDVRTVVDRQFDLFAEAKSPTAFFELPDGRMRAAQALLPDGTDWKQMGSGSPRSSLAAWITQSEAFDRAIVNQVWTYLAGRSLVPQVAISDLAGLQARREIQELLAEEFRASGHDIRRLAVWILASSVMDRMPPNESADSIRLASRERLQELTLQRAVFAAPMPETQLLNFEQSIRVAMKFRANKDVSTLAQPDLSRLPGKKRQSVENNQVLPLSFALYGERPATQDVEYIDSLLSAQRLSWADRVRHVALLEPQITGDGRIQFLAQSLLQQHNGDARAALLDFLWAVTSSSQM